MARRMVVLLALTLSLLALAAAPALAQNYILNVQVESARGALSGASVVASGNGLNLRATTGSNGVATFPSLPSGTYQLIITKDTYVEVDKSVTLIGTSQSVDLTVIMISSLDQY